MTKSENNLTQVNEPLITFDQKTQVFHLHNKHLSYLLSIDEGGILSHLYFGRRIRNYHGQRRSPRRDRGFSGNLPGTTDRTYSLDSLLREYSGKGDGDFRTPALVVRQADGSHTIFLTYRSHQIVSGKPSLEGLPAAYVETDEEAQTLIVTLEDEVSSLRVDLFYTIYRDRNVVARSVKIKNTGRTTIHLEKVASMQMDFNNRPLDVISLPGAHANERHQQREAVGFGIKEFSSSRGTTSHQMNSFIALCDPDTNEFHGEVYGFSFVYSGNHKESVEMDQFRQTRVTVGINDDQFDWQLTPNESFQAPEVLMVYSNHGLNGMSQTFHHLLRERIARGKNKYRERPIVINNWEATFFDFNESKLKKIVDEAKNVGIEMFVLDDGWFGHRDNDDSSLGDWQVFEKKFPNGLRRFSDYVHQQGMKMGIWFEPEMISYDSDLYRQHPDYLLKVPGRKPTPSRDQYVLDMGRQEVRDNIFNQMKQLLQTENIDYVKWDMNRHLTDVYSTVLPAERQGETLHRYVLGLYELLEKLTTKFPNILWEGCSGGGGRIDAGFMYYMPQSWASDNTDAIARLTIQYGTSLAYPISSMTAHVSESPNQQTGRATPLKTRADVAMSGVFGYELDLTKMTAMEKMAIKKQVTLYKEIRPVIQYGNFIRLINPNQNNRCAWIFVAPDKKEAVAFSFHVLSSAQPTFDVLRLAGLDSDRNYQNVATGKVIGGDELMNTGFYEKIDNFDFSSHLYHFKVVTV
ncbi:alpha-galactosidase [Lentilactobacillus hilgardii]|uniref:alpha-galactosidase n=1 Tax=Lentilactobacillus hilgardii TaxID=1588 RepID=UPI0039EC1457